MTDIGVEPYREITFDADGDADPAERAALTGVDATDLVLFAHGWNNTPTSARGLFRAYFAAYPALLTGSPGVRLAYGGVIWPSIRFADESIPELPARRAERPRARTRQRDRRRPQGVLPRPGRRPSTGSPPTSPNARTAPRRSPTSGG